MKMFLSHLLLIYFLKCDFYLDYTCIKIFDILLHKIDILYYCFGEGFMTSFTVPASYQFIMTFFHTSKSFKKKILNVKKKMIQKIMRMSRFICKKD